MQGINDSLNLYGAKKTLPLPDDYITIDANGNTIWYQWYAGANILELINYTSGWKDPKDDAYYTYYLSSDRKNVQLLWFLEETDGLQTSLPFIGQTYAADYTIRNPKVYGKKLWILVSNVTSTLNTPAQEITTTSVDIDTSTIYTAYLSDSDKITSASVWDLLAMIPNGDCNRIKQTGNSDGDGLYLISPTGSWTTSVYCDMTIAWGWWTLVGRSVSGWSWAFGWGSTLWTVSTNTASYSLGTTTTDMSFSEIMAARYSSSKNIDYAITFGASSDDLDTGTSWTTATTNCDVKYDLGLTTTEKAYTWHCTLFTYWWDGNNVAWFWFGSSSTPSAVGLEVGSWDRVSKATANWAWHGDQGMIFVR